MFKLEIWVSEVYIPISHRIKQKKPNESKESFDDMNALYEKYTRLD